MSADDIIKAREGLAKLLEIALALSRAVKDCPDISLPDARESLAAFERLVADPVAAPPQMPMRAYIASQIAGHMVGRNMLAHEIAESAVYLADALIERLKRPLPESLSTDGAEKAS